jgi:hypothetical protein
MLNGEDHAAQLRTIWPLDDLIEPPQAKRANRVLVALHAADWTTDQLDAKHINRGRLRTGRPGRLAALSAVFFAAARGWPLDSRVSFLRRPLVRFPDGPRFGPASR